MSCPFRSVRLVVGYRPKADEAACPVIVAFTLQGIGH